VVTPNGKFLAFLGKTTAVPTRELLLKSHTWEQPQVGNFLLIKSIGWSGKKLVSGNPRRAIFNHRLFRAFSALVLIYFPRPPFRSRFSAMRFGCGLAPRDEGDTLPGIAAR
jgi:hypothetical protein